MLAPSLVLKCTGYQFPPVIKHFFWCFNSINEFLIWLGTSIPYYTLTQPVGATGGVSSYYLRPYVMNVSGGTSNASSYSKE